MINNTLKDIVDEILLYRENFEQKVNCCTTLIHKKETNWTGQEVHRLYFQIDHEKLNEYKNLLQQYEKITQKLDEYK
jgi:hypothetical protein